ncbi:MAG: DUF3883 domain-containing protein [Nitrosospira sp.]|nr:DUF3883 domain-containing protein [Nitrosospira sp.]
MAPPGVRQIIVDAGLAHGDDEETVKFWDMLAARARGLRDSRLSDIGRQGERLTVEHERKRTGIAPKWIALESNSDGYDILSRVIDRASGLLTIEVKTTTVPGLSGYFHVTRKEWEVATLSLNHRFHLWDISSHNPQLAVLDVEAVASHISNDLGDGLWESVKIPFSTFRNSFTNECNFPMPD